MKLSESEDLDKVDCLRIAGAINRLAISAAFLHIRNGISLKETDEWIGRYIKKLGGMPAFYGYNDFPANACISVNDEVVHGIPDNRIAQQGDIVTVDIGTKFGEWMVDSARTEIIGRAKDASHEHLVQYGREVLYGGLLYVAPGAVLSTIASKMDAVAHERYLTIIPQLGGHRIGKTVHESPFIPMTMYTNSSNDYDYGYTLSPGDVMCFEPAVVHSEYSSDIELMEDNWTIKTKDGGMSAHFEHTVLVTEHGHEVIS